MKRVDWILLALCLSVAVACGGGGGDDSDDPTMDIVVAKDIPVDKGTTIDLTLEEIVPDPVEDVIDIFVFDWGTDGQITDTGKSDLTDQSSQTEVKPKDIPPDLGPPGVKIADIQQAEDSLNCSVIFATMLISVDIPLKKVVVTAPPYAFAVVGEKLDGFYVADQEGGIYSGIHVTYPTNQIPPIEPGMILTLVGDHYEAFCFTDFRIKSLVVEQDSGPEPAPALTTPEQIAAEPEIYEGMLVRVENVTVTDDNLDFGDGMDLQEFEVDGTLRVGNDYEVKYMTPATDARLEGDVFQYIVGVVKFSDEKWHLMPRYNTDMLLEGETLPEVGPEVMADVYTADGESDAYFEDVVADGDYEVIEQDDSVEDVPVESDVVLEDVPDQADADQSDVPVVEDVMTLDVPSEPDTFVIITEIMYDPSSIPDPLGEWIEIYNATDEAIDLNGWRLADEVGNLHIIQNGAPYMMQPGQFLVLGNNPDDITNGGVEIDYLYSKDEFTLQNKADSVILQNLMGAPVDTVHYDELQDWPEAKGASLELKHPNLDNENPNSWKVATTPYGDESNMGSPGSGTWPEK
jgi:hypothetical protein